MPADKIDFYIENVNFLGNLQLLEPTPNEEKNNKDFEEFLTEREKLIVTVLKKELM